MGFPKYVVGGDITISGQHLMLHNNSPSDNTTSGYDVASIFGQPISAEWVGKNVEFTTHKGKAFTTDGLTERELI
jgi:hypothetical protein